MLAKIVVITFPQKEKTRSYDHHDIVVVIIIVVIIVIILTIVIISHQRTLKRMLEMLKKRVKNVRCRNLINVLKMRLKTMLLTRFKDICVCSIRKLWNITDFFNLRTLFINKFVYFRNNLRRKSSPRGLIWWMLTFWREPAYRDAANNHATFYSRIFMIIAQCYYLACKQRKKKSLNDSRLPTYIDITFTYHLHVVYTSGNLLNSHYSLDIQSTISCKIRNNSFKIRI